MSNMQIEIVNVSTSHVPTAKGGYMVADVAYKNKSFQDKLEGKKIMDFANKDVYSKLTKATFGETFEVTRQKSADDKYWNWVALNPAGSAPAEVSNAVPCPTSGGYAAPMKSVNVTPKSTYETPEERAARQVLIVRQSSLGHALEYTATNKIKDEAEVLALANRFSDWVFQKEGINAVAKSVLEVSAGFFGDMEDDLP
jgi:hypothetical protein